MSDLISRQDAIETLKGFDVEIIPYEHGKMYVQETLNAIYHRINNIPSAESERTAKVIEHKYFIGTALNIVGAPKFGYEYLCGKCKKKVIGGDEYCSHCGCRLEWNHE